MAHTHRKLLAELVSLVFVSCLIVAFFALAAPAKTPTRGAAEPATSRVAGPVPVPGAGELYWGAWTDRHRTGTEPPWDMAGTRDIESDAGKGMSLQPFATPFADHSGRKYFEFPAKQFDSIRAHGSIPYFQWSTHALRNYRNRRFTLRAVIAGRHDEYIRRWARAAKAWGNPFLLRFNWEMNGDDFPWAERFGSNRRGEFVKAWRHVHRIFDAVGADNVAWVWCPAADPYDTEQPLKGLYPGREYVDWSCIDAYNSYSRWMSFAELVKPMYREITRELAPGKPMLIGETASTEIGGDKADWITGMFASLRSSFPAVRGVVWFDKDTNGPGGRGKLPLDSSPSATRAFSRGVAPASVQSNTFDSLAIARPESAR